MAARRKKKRRDSYDGVEIYIETVGPKEATEYLKRNKFNRQPKPKKILSYARDMAEGRWGICNDAVCVDPEGRLLNGQNRMKAIVESRAEINMVVMHGVPTDSFGHMDSGAPRTIKDALVLDGCEPRYALTVGQILRGIWLQRRKKLYTIASGGGAIIITPEELLKIWRSDGAGVLKTATWSVDTHQPAVKIYCVRVLRFLACEKHPRLGAEFCDILRDGIADRTHPAMKLRIAIEKHRASNQFTDRKGRLSRAQQMAYTIIAWNSFFKKTPLTTLRWQILGDRAGRKGVTAEDHFPILEL